MNEYTIYCTEEQARKALKLGAKIEIQEYYPLGEIEPDWFHDEDKCYHTPTAEQMICWLEEQEGVYDIHLLRTADGKWKYGITTKYVSDNPMYGICRSRKEATLAAIDGALDYLSKNK